MIIKLMEDRSDGVFRKPFFYLLICICFSTKAQLASNYLAAPIQDTIPAFYSEQIKTRLNTDLLKAANFRGKVGASMKELLTERAGYVIENFNEDFFIIDPRFTGYLQDVLAKIYQANPQLPKETTVFAHRSSASNAISFGEGTIAFTLGLLCHLETESQIAFVLCHELAHYHSNHSNEKIQSIAQLYNSKEFKNELRAINRSEYGQYTRYVKLVSSLGISVSKHGREKEFEADSLAFFYFVNVSTDFNAPIRTLEILDSLDVDRKIEPIKLKKHFHFLDYPFKESWIEYDSQIIWSNRDKEIQDSLRTHPSCDLRIKAIQRQMVNSAAINSRNLVLGKPTEIVLLSQFERIESQYHLKNYGRAMYNSLMLLEQFPQNAYLHAMVGKCLYQLYAYQKRHELGKVLPLPDPRFGESYDRFLTFLQSLRLSELEALTNHYMNEKKGIYSNDEYFLFALWLCAHTDPREANLKSIQNEYIRKFPKGKYTQQFNLKF
jgi:Zn-dependent protease with chaperone function